MRRMMLDPIPKKLKQLWDICDLRGFIIFSLLLQAFLIFVAPLRKRTRSTWIMAFLWCAYLSADWAANFAVGLILNSQGDPGETSRKRDRSPVEHEDLLAFWAPFLLVHLGGPDTITAFALEDNELWVRHLLGLVFQCIAVVYVFILSLPQNQLWIPTVLIFVTGMIKYIERSRSLYLASVDKFKYSMLKEADPGKNYAKLMDEHFSMKEAKLPTRIATIPETVGLGKSAIKAGKENLTELQVVQFGHQFFEKYNGLYVDMIFNLKEWNESREFFSNRTAKDAFSVVEVELNFLYDVLFTKLPVVYSKFGAINRIVSLVAVCIAIILFVFKSKSNFRNTDIIITYALLVGALVLDISALLMLVFSDWTIVSFRKLLDGPLCISLKTRFRKLLKHGDKTEYRTRRWSESIPSYNLIYYCMHPRPEIWKQVVDTLGLSDYLDSVVYVKSKKVSESLREFIFEELKAKSEFVDDLPMATAISLERGAWVLETEGWDRLVKYVSDVDYDQSLILWHMATEICYNSELDEQVRMVAFHEHTEKREISKLLSDYMMYLLSMQPTMMSAVAGVGQIRFIDACAEICAQVNRISDNEKYAGSVNDFQRGMIEARVNREFDFKHINVCMGIRKASAELNSLLFESCSLVTELMNMEDRWVIISKVWVEMLCYAASHSRASMQVSQVSKGGELITIVWLLMTHFGLGDRFQHNKRKTTAQLFLGK